MEILINTPPPHSRSSIVSLSDLLADLDENQLHYILQEMNHTTSQNMAVSQAISAIESDNPSSALGHARLNMHPPQMKRSISTSQRLRMSLQTILRPNRISSAPCSATSATSSTRSSPSYKRISRPFINFPPNFTVADLQALLHADSFMATSTADSPTSLKRIRRHPSNMDLALEAEKSAVGPESLGLGLLEPRPTTPLLSPAPNSISLNSSPVVLDGIFETMEAR